MYHNLSFNMKRLEETANNGFCHRDWSKPINALNMYFQTKYQKNVYRTLPHLPAQDTSNGTQVWSINQLLTCCLKCSSINRHKTCRFREQTDWTCWPAAVIAARNPAFVVSDIWWRTHSNSLFPSTLRSLQSLKSHLLRGCKETRQKCSVCFRSVKPAYELTGPTEWVLWNFSFALHRLPLCVKPLWYFSSPPHIFPSHLFYHAPLKKQTGVFKPRQWRFDVDWEVGLRTQKRLGTKGLLCVSQSQGFTLMLLTWYLSWKWFTGSFAFDLPGVGPKLIAPNIERKILKLYFFNEPVTNLCVHRVFPREFGVKNGQSSEAN